MGSIPNMTSRNTSVAPIECLPRQCLQSPRGCSYPRRESLLPICPSFPLPRVRALRLCFLSVDLTITVDICDKCTRLTFDLSGLAAFSRFFHVACINTSCVLLSSKASLYRCAQALVVSTQHGWTLNQPYSLSMSINVALNSGVHTLVWTYIFISPGEIHMCYDIWHL